MNATRPPSAARDLATQWLELCTTETNLSDRLKEIRKQKDRIMTEMVGAVLEPQTDLFGDGDEPKPAA